MSTSAGEAPYELVVPGPVSRAIREELPEAVAWAVIEFVNGPLADNPYRVGAELRGHLRGIHSAHLATFRIQYVIDDEQRTVTLRRVKPAATSTGSPEIEMPMLASRPRARAGVRADHSIQALHKVR